MLPILLFKNLVFPLTFVGQLIGTGLLYIRRVGFFVQDVITQREHELMALDLNPARDLWQLKNGIPVYRLRPYWYGEAETKSPVLSWAQGSYLFLWTEKLDFDTFLQITLHNYLSSPAERIPCGIDGPRLAYVGRERWKDHLLVAEAMEKNEQEPA